MLTGKLRRFEMSNPHANNLGQSHPPWRLLTTAKRYMTSGNELSIDTPECYKYLLVMNVHPLDSRESALCKVSIT